MTMDIAPFKGFLLSLSSVSNLNFQVWDGNGLIFASGDDHIEEPYFKTHQDFSARVMSKKTYQHEPCQSQYALFGTPIKYGEEIVGSLIAYGTSSDRAGRPGDTPPVNASNAQDMETFLTHVAGLIEDKWEIEEETEEMAEELAQNFEDLALFGRISTQIKSLKFSDEMLKTLMDEVLETMRVDLTFVQMPERQEYNVLACTNEISDKIPDQDSFVDGLLKAIPQERLPFDEDYFIVNNSLETPGFMELHSDPYRFLAVEISYNGSFEGWLGLVSFNLTEIFRQSELRLLKSMTRQIAVLMANLDLYRDLENFVINVVKSLVYAIEAKDIYTRGHSERVNQYCMFMADRLYFDENQKEALNWASILHDIGKIGIPESILNKEGHLDDREYGIIKGHPQKGSNILEPLVDQLSSSIPSILHHHERYDGQGYPAGLKGEKIPMLARVIAIADTFDAINSTRAYRSAKGPEKAMEIIEKVAGSQLDPKLVKVFKDVYNEKIIIGKEEKNGQ